jgi:hypothetical protein
LHLIFFHYDAPKVVSVPNVSDVVADISPADLPRLAFLNDAAFSASVRAGATSTGFGGSGGGGGGADGLDPPPML